MSNINRNRNIDTAFKYVGIFCTLFGIVMLLMTQKKDTPSGIPPEADYYRTGQLDAGDDD